MPWRKHTDPDSGNDFYFNRDTNEKSWDPPADVVGGGQGGGRNGKKEGKKKRKKRGKKGGKKRGKNEGGSAHDEGDSDEELSKDEFVAFVKATKKERVSIAAEIEYIYEQIWYLKERRVEHDSTQSKWGSALDELFKLMDPENSGSVGMDAVKKIFLAAGCPEEHLRLAAEMATEKTTADAGDDASLDKAAFIAFGKTTNGADDTIESFIASLYLEVAKLIMADVEDVSKDEGGEQKGDAGELDVIHVTVDTGVRW